MSDRHLRRAGSDYREAFLELLPQGQAWPKHSMESVLWRVCDGLNYYWGFVDGRAADLLERESDPRITIELLSDWERNWGLPDPCYTAPQTIDDRHTALIARMTLYGSQSREFYINFAKFIGYNITISEYRPFVCGLDRCGDSRVYGDGSIPYYNPAFVRGYLPVLDDRGNPVALNRISEYPNYGLGPAENRYYWTVHLDTAKLTWFRCAGSQCGVDPHLRIGVATDLECIINRWKPAHTFVIFDYSGLGSRGSAAGFGTATGRVALRSGRGQASGLGSANASSGITTSIGDADGFGDAFASPTPGVGVGNASTVGTANGVAGSVVSTGGNAGAVGVATGVVSIAPSPVGPFNDQTGDFSIQYDVVPTTSSATENVVIGLSDGGPPSAVTQLACITRFFTSGTIDCRNGGAYAASSTVPYTVGQTYHFRMVVRLSNHTYDVFVTPQGQAETLLASNFAFRTEQASVVHLNYLGMIISGGSATISNMIGPPPRPGAPAPVASAASFSLTTSGSGWVAGVGVGRMTATNYPTSWAITAGNNNGYYAIDVDGNITVTAAGIPTTALGNHNGTSSLTCQASNAAGNSNATATITYAPAATTGFPTAASTGVPAGTVLTNSGPTTFSTAGQTINAVHFAGPITINASNVTIQNCFIDLTGAGFANTNNGITVQGGLTGVLIKNCTITGFGINSTQNQYGINFNGDSTVTVDGCNFSFWGHSMYTTSNANITIQNCYGDNLTNQGGSPHYEHFYIGRMGGSLMMQNNTFINQNGWTAVIFFKTDFGNIANCTLQNNLFISSAWYALYINTGTAGTVNGPTMKLLNNAVQLKNDAHPTGQHYWNIDTSGVVLSGNHDYITNANIDNPSL